MDWSQILNFAGSAATVAGSYGVPFAGLGGTILKEANTLIDKISASTGKTREEIIAEVQAQDAENLAELTADQLKGE